MHRKLTLLAGILTGAAAAVSTVALRRRLRAGSTAVTAATVDPRVEELGRKLAAARARDENAPAPAALDAEPPRGANGLEPSGDEVEAMRRRVHAEAREAAEEMRRRSETET